ncbi:hypothetical protein [Desulfobacter postgatei]|uniref:hypothetical protein n=1 Tax=Desulfobacter postgatei TaxID=2293 RepID=UPI00259B9C20|nr:hypothetical protein [uncultured Desulfobacter sp.]
MIEAIDGQECERMFLKSGRDSEWLARFLKKYPAGFRLSWVKNHMADLYGRGAWDEIDTLRPGRGERRHEPPLKKAFVDYLIFERITGLLMQGYPLTGEKGAILRVVNTGIDVGGETLTLGFDQVKDRYYRFRKHDADRIIDNGRLIVGPAKVEADVNGETVTFIGFWEYAPPD